MNGETMTERTDRGANADGLRAQLHGMWDSVAAGWAEHASFVNARGAALTRELLDLTRPAGGERVLELAAGAGDVGIAAARLVGPEGEVVISDVSGEMVAIARDRARETGNVTTRVLDLEAIAERDESFDVVLCREGLMLVPEPRLAAREIHRVLRPGGRLALAVWGPRERNPWLAVVFDSVSAQLAVPTPPPGIPGPFSLDDPDVLEATLRGGGFAELQIHEVPAPYRATSAEEWWGRTAALAGPLAQKLAALPEPVADELRARAFGAIGAYETGTGLEIPGVSLVAFAVKA